MHLLTFSRCLDAGLSPSRACKLGQPWKTPRCADFEAPESLTCVADTCIVYLDADFMRLRDSDLNVLNGKVLASFPCYSSLAGDWLFITSAIRPINATMFSLPFQRYQRT